MEFEGYIENEQFMFSLLSNGYFFITGKENSYIIYKSKRWLCADEISDRLLRGLGQIIDNQMHLKRSVKPNQC
jgi:hypothetical protein